MWMVSEQETHNEEGLAHPHMHALTHACSAFWSHAGLGFTAHAQASCCPALEPLLPACCDCPSACLLQLSSAAWAYTG